MARKTNFIKDYKQTKSLEEAGKEASVNAVRHARALDLTITYIENGIVYEEHPDGSVIQKKKIAIKEAPVTLTKGMVLHAK